MQTINVPPDTTAASMDTTHSSPQESQAQPASAPQAGDRPAGRRISVKNILVDLETDHIIPLDPKREMQIGPLHINPDGLSELYFPETADQGMQLPDMYNRIMYMALRDSQGNNEQVFLGIIDSHAVTYLVADTRMTFAVRNFLFGPEKGWIFVSRTIGICDDILSLASAREGFNYLQGLNPGS